MFKYLLPINMKYNANVKKNVNIFLFYAIDKKVIYMGKRNIVNY